MEEYQKKMVEELDELGDKIERLSDLIYSEEYVNFPRDMRIAMWDQFIAMRSYYDALIARIELEGIDLEHKSE